RWPDATRAALERQSRYRDARAAISELGYEVTAARPDSPALLLTGAGQRLAIAVELAQTEAPGGPSARFGGLSPGGDGPVVTAPEQVPGLVVAAGTRLRLYPVGQPGTDGQGHVEVDLHALGGATAGYLALLFSQAALRLGGSAWQILAAARDGFQQRGDDQA